MISLVLSRKIFNKIKNIFPIGTTDKIFLPIINNPLNLEYFLKFFPNKLVISIPNYSIYSQILKNQFFTEEIIKNRIEINMDFFGVFHRIDQLDFTKIVIFFPNNLALNLVNFALYQMSKILGKLVSLLIIVNNKKQKEVILNWLGENEIMYTKTKIQDISFYIIPEIQPSKIENLGINDYVFSINYFKKTFTVLK